MAYGLYFILLHMGKPVCAHVSAHTLTHTHSHSPALLPDSSSHLQTICKGMLLTYPHPPDCLFQLPTIRDGETWSLHTEDTNHKRVNTGEWECKAGRDAF